MTIPSETNAATQKANVVTATFIPLQKRQQGGSATCNAAGNSASAPTLFPNTRLKAA
jgi:hypothetical protein